MLGDDKGKEREEIKTSNKMKKRDLSSRIELSEVLWIECAKYLDAVNVCNLARTQRSFVFVLKNSFLWRCFTRELLSTRPRYQMKKEEEDRLETSRFFLLVSLLRRIDGEQFAKEIEPLSFLISNRWFFNYTAQAGSCGKATVQEVEFRGDGLLYFERGYPPMQWSMGGTDRSHGLSQVREMIHSLMSGRQTFPRNNISKQYIRIADFPVHDVEWNKNRWEWRSRIPIVGVGHTREG